MESEVKWTEGPWGREEDEIFAKTNGGYVHIADTRPLPGDLGPDQSEQEIANGNLIAAAPDLYEAAKNALELLESRSWGDSLEARELRTALSRARGAQ